MRLSVGETAKRLGISVRTLHYYDEIGLLKPSETTEAGYRFYDAEALATLQQILFLRELELSLDEIRALLARPDHDKRAILAKHKELLLLKREHLDELIALVEATIGGKTMKKPNVSSQDIQQTKEKYAQEVREKWGDTQAYAESEKRHSAYTGAQEEAIAQDANDIFAAFAASMDAAPDSDAARALVERWKGHIDRYHYPCSKEILSSLADMYVGDPRFTQNIDRFGDGTAQFMHDAIKAYCA